MPERITQKFIAKLLPPPSGNLIEYDAEIPGFGVRITAAGIVAFVLNYRINGRERRYTIGRHPELSATAARARAIQLRGRLLEGIDPLEQRHQNRTEPALDDLARQYLEEYATVHKRATSIRNDRQMIEKIIVPKLGKLRLRSIVKSDIQSLHKSLRKTPYRANRVLALLSKMFSLAISWQLIAQNPVHGVPRCQEDKREKWLTEDEITRFRQALDSYKDQNAANALRLLLLTGSRVGEVLNATWEQFDFDHGIWTKPSHNTKQKRIEHIPLSKPALQLLKDMRPKKATGLLFPGAVSEARVSLRRPWVQACKEAGLVAAEVVKGKRRMMTRYKPTIRLHDLRHSYASHLVSNGVSLHVVGKLLGRYPIQKLLILERLRTIDDKCKSESKRKAAFAIH